MTARIPWILLGSCLLSVASAQAQERFDPRAAIAAQKKAMSALSKMDGTWRGTATRFTPDGKKVEMTQTERVGPMLDGAIKVVEGRGYETDGKLSFNAFATISFNTRTGVYSMHSNAQGMVGDYTVKPTDDGFAWEIPAGPATIRYTATIKDGVWHEVGERVVKGQAPIKIVEMTLKRIGDTTWPAEGAIGVK